MPALHLILSYADDTTLVANLNDYDNIELNSEIDKIRLWLVANQLNLTAAKSKYIMFKPLKMTKFRC